MAIVKIPADETQRTKPSAREVRLRKRAPIYAVLENIRSLFNVGAMFRTSDAALVSKVFLTGITASPPHAEIDKSALGATDVVPWEYCRDCQKPIKELKAAGIFIVALELTRQSVCYTDFKYSFPVCLIVGNEIEGVSQETLNLCDAAIDISMFGRATSLNVATAYGISLFEILRQYKIKQNLIC